MRHTLTVASLGAALLFVFVLGGVGHGAAASVGRGLLAWIPAAEAAEATRAVSSPTGPAAGAASGSDQQYGGIIYIDPP